MGENFFITINCSKILADSDEGQYTMFIDNTKISIVYELIEWIRWMFSIEYCIYLSHGNSVIHELEDIQILSKLRNLEIKPCGRSHCVHKTTYRILLSNLNLFVSWNEMKVHKYFVDKINRIEQKLTQKGSGINTSVISSNNKAHEDLMNCKNSTIRNVNDLFSDNQVSNCNVKQSPFSNLNRSASVIDNLESEAAENESLKLMRPCFNKSPAKSPLVNELEVVKVSNNNYKKSKSRKNSYNYVKPFSVGEILSNIRRDFEKQNSEVTTEKDLPPINFSLFEGDFNDKMVTENSSFISDDKVTEIKKRQRTRRRRRKSKKQTFEDETFASPELESNGAVSNLNFLKSDSISKPNHIRFDTDDEDAFVDNNSVEENINTQNKSEFEIIHEKMDDLDSLTFVRGETEKSSTVLNENYQGVSDSQLLNPPIIVPENKMECSSAVDDLIQIGEQQSDQISNNINQSCSKVDNFQAINFNPDLSILESLKENCKNSLVIKRFY